MGRGRDVPNYCLNGKNTECLDDEIIKIFRRHEVNLVVLAGYMKKVDRKVINAYPNRILNIYPALLPKYEGKDMYGMAVHEAVIASNDLISGATVHVVTENYDEGMVLAQNEISRESGDTVKTLAEKVLRAEHILYSETLRCIQKGIITLDP